MNPNEYEVLYSLEDHYWWYVARRELIGQVVQRIASPRAAQKILDVGCGTGANSAMLTRHGWVAGTDASEHALEFCHRRALPNLFRSRIERLPLLPNSLDMVVVLDVLEHVDNDLAVLEELRRVLRPGGSLVATVPAFGFLWSEHDEALHHRRRYTGYELRNKLTRSGFEVERCSFYLASLFFPILFIRSWQNIFKRSAIPKTSHVILPRWINRLLIAVLAIERRVFGWINLPFGVSLVAVAVRPESDAGETEAGVAR